MTRFAFEAQDRQGRVVRGTREAQSVGDVEAALRARELSVTQIRPAPGQPSPGPQVLGGLDVVPGVQNLLAAPAAAMAPVAASASAPSASAPSASAPSASAPSASAPSAGAGGVPGGADFGAAAVGGFLHQPARVGGKAVASAGRDWVSRASAMQLSLYFRQSHALLHAGSSISHALAVASRHDASPSLRRASEEMSRATAGGTPWSDAMRGYPGLFTELSVGMVAAGESSGRVDEACQRLASYSERDYHLQQTIKRETWYPKLLVACSVLIPSVVPLVLGELGPWWASVRAPLFTMAMLALAWRGLQWASPLSGQVRSVARVLDGVKMRLPVAGKVARGFASAKFCRALGATLGAGVPVNRAMSLAASACDNMVLAEAAERARLQVLEGDTLTGALGATRQFPPVAMQMLATGEASGQTEEQLEKVADFLEGDAETAVKQAVKLLGVLVLLLVAWQIGSQVLSFYSGFYSGAEGAADSIMGDV